MYDKGSLPYEWHQELFDYSREKGLIPFSSVFDYEGLDFLLKLDIPILKISSYEANDPNFVETVLDTGIPTFISIGGLLSSEFERLIEKVDNSNNKQVVILNCLSAYPAPMSEFNFKRTSKLINKYGLLTGLSDHSIDEKAAIISLALGAKVFEKHVTLSDSDNIADKSFSSDIKKFSNYCKSIRDAEKGLKNDEINPQQSEIPNLFLKRSIVATETIQPGEIFNENNIGVKRPNVGLEPYHFNDLIGRKSINHYSPGDGIDSIELS